MRNATHPSARVKSRNIDVALTREEINERFDEELKRRYWGERALLEVLPMLANAATSYELVTALQAHAKVTEHQIDRLLHVFDILGERALSLKYETMTNLLADAYEALTFKTGIERDEAIANICKRIMLHEIAVYEKMRGYSKVLEHAEATDYIAKAIHEERFSHELFTEIELQSIYAN